MLTGLDIEAKAALVRAQMADALAARPPAELRWELARTDHADAATEEAASALLRLVARDPDAKAVGRGLGAAAVELALASYPGFHVTAPPARRTPYGVFERRTSPRAPSRTWRCCRTGGASRSRRPCVPRRCVPYPNRPRTLGGRRARRHPPRSPGRGRGRPQRRQGRGRQHRRLGPARRLDPEHTAAIWHWLLHTLTVDRLRTLLPECAELTIVRHVLPNLRALNFVVEGVLGDGVAARHRFDPQAKALGEWLRSRWLDIPEALLDAPGGPLDRVPRRAAVPQRSLPPPGSAVTTLASALDTAAADTRTPRTCSASSPSWTPSTPRRSRAAGRSTSSATATAASCSPANASSCCSTRTRPSWSCRRWRPGAATTRWAPPW